LLVQPPDNYYWERFTEIHDISAKNTLNAPTFDQIWHNIAPLIENQNVIAHYGFGYDFRILSKTL
jgi:DNA polymerase-3 subunit epsilon